MKLPFDLRPVKLEGGIIARLRLNADGGATSEVWDGKAWVVGADVSEIMFEGQPLQPDEINKLKLLP
jgi:hypothetical protein